MQKQKIVTVKQVKIMLKDMQGKEDKYWSLTIGFYPGRVCRESWSCSHGNQKNRTRQRKSKLNKSKSGFKPLRPCISSNKRERCDKD